MFFNVLVSVVFLVSLELSLALFCFRIVTSLFLLFRCVLLINYNFS